MGYGNIIENILCTDARSIVEKPFISFKNKFNFLISKYNSKTVSESAILSPNIWLQLSGGTIVH